MQGKTETDLINAAAAGKIKVCPNCQASNDVNAQCCTTCGSEFDMNEAPRGATPFAPVDEMAATAESRVNGKVSARQERRASGVFAEGLPMWTLEPPQVVVRRKR